MTRNPKEPGVIGAYCSKEMEGAFTYYAKARNMSKSKLVGLLLFPALMRLLSGDADLPPGQWVETLKEQALAVLKNFRSASEKHSNANLPGTLEFPSYISVVSTPKESSQSENVPALNSETSEKRVKRKIKKLRTAQKEIMERGSRKTGNSQPESKAGNARPTS